MDEAQYRADQKARAELTAKSLEVSDKSQPTPTQEENDLLKLGLMNPDDKANPDNPTMPPLGVQQEMLQRAQESTTPAPRREPYGGGPDAPRHTPAPPAPHAPAHPPGGAVVHPNGGSTKR